VDNPQPKLYQTKPVTVSAIKWTEELGAQFGVKNRLKKHPMNPDYFHVRDRFGKEKPIESGDYVITYKDGASDVVRGAAFDDLYVEQQSEHKVTPEPCQKN